MTEWTPTANMTALLNYLQERDYNASVIEACQQVGITRQAYYQWFDNPEFVAWWSRELNGHMTRRVTQVYGQLAAAACERFAGGKDPDPKPDAALIKLFLERFDEGYAPKERKEISGTVAVNHSAMIAAAMNGGFQRTSRISDALRPEGQN